MLTCPSCSASVSSSGGACPGCGASLEALLHDAPTIVHAGAASGGGSPAPGAGTPPRALFSERFAPGTLILDRYRISGLVGRGGMGEVYRAEDLKLGMTVALKFLPGDLSSDPAFLERFHNEVRIARQVTHPDVCRVYDIGEMNGQHFLSMEFVDGEDLASLLRRIGRLPQDKAIEIALHLCGAIAAAHSKGVLLRDLKPANIMIDGRGNVRVTDFGLASLIEEAQRTDVGAGTPAYMAPEQLSGQPASVRSDIFSLGLVLYEMFTGRPAFQPESIAALARLRGRTPPPTPTSLVSGLDPRIDRAILCCLEPEPGRRPASALAVTAMLPGGDPLAAAMAAGETPSPEMVAASGGREGLAPGTAWACLAAGIAGLALISLMTGRTMLIHRVPFDKSPAVLVDRAHEILASVDSLPAAGATRASEAWGLLSDDDLLAYAAANDRTPHRWDALASGRPAALLFWFRRSPQLMMPGNPFGRISLVDPPPFQPGMVSLLLDTKGRLIELNAIPSTARRLDEVAPAFGWEGLFNQAGLNLAKFKPVEPTWVPPVSTDVSTAWEGVFPDGLRQPIHVEAGSLHGRPVYFQIIGPWTKQTHIEPFAQSPAARASEAINLMLHFIVLGGSTLLALANMKSGRGDWKGALKCAFFLFASIMLSWILYSGHLTAVNEEWEMFQKAEGLALFIAVFFWSIYVALEPYVRSRWPHRIISWSRLLAGRFFDPLVGRDILIGGAFGVLWVLLTQIQHLAPGWIGLPPATPGVGHLDAVLSVRDSLALFFEVQPACIVAPMAYMFIILILQIFLRKEPLALTAFFILLTTRFALQGDSPSTDFPLSALIVASWIFLLVRFGLLAFIAAHFVHLAADLPMTLDFSTWYAASSILALLLAAAVLAYGFYFSIGGKSALALPDLGP